MGELSALELGRNFQGCMRGLAIGQHDYENEEDKILKNEGDDDDDITTVALPLVNKLIILSISQSPQIISTPYLEVKKYQILYLYLQFLTIFDCVFQVSASLACLRGIIVTLIAFVWFLPRCVFKCLLKWLAREDA